MANQPSIKPQIPAKIGRYILKAQLGRGGMGTVYLGYDPRVERDVAVKALPREFQHDPMFQARFEREAKTIAQLDHPAVVPIHDYGKDSGQPYLVMRYMSGGTLSDRLKLAPLSITEIIQILKRVGPVLDEVHKRNIYHRDIKPSNILFDRYGHAYLSDFGMVRLDTVSSELTGSHAAVGTPGYMSPEQIRGKEIDNRSDIYGLGVLIFEAVTGKRPFVAETPAMVIVKQMSGPVPSIRDYRPELPQSYAKIVQRLMAKKPVERPETAAEVIDLLVEAVRIEELGEEASTVAKSEDPATADSAPALPSEMPTQAQEPEEADASEAEAPTELEAPTVAEALTEAEAPFPAPPPTEIVRIITERPLIAQPPPTVSLAVHEPETLSERDITEQIIDESLEIYCPNCTKVLDIYGKHDPIRCPHCKHRFRAEGHLCPYCFAFHEEQATLCLRCDTPLTRVCPECLVANWSGAEKCKSCATSLDIFAILQLPEKHAPAERVRRQEKHLKVLRKVQEQQTEDRMTALSAEIAEAVRERRRLTFLKVVTYVGLALALILLVLVLVNGI